MSRYRRVSTGTLWEDAVGYSRAVRIGNTIAVSGTTASGADAYEQTRNALAVIVNALAELGASTTDVIRTRIFVTDISHWEAIGRAHAEVFATVRPTSTMVEVSHLISPECLVEIEADAIVTAS